MKYLNSKIIYLFIGILLSLTIYSVDAALTATTVNNGDMLTASRWNAVVNDLNSIINNGDINANCVVYTSAPNPGSATIGCPVGKKPISGGCRSTCVMINENYMDGTTQHCQLQTAITQAGGFCAWPGQEDVTAYINCCNFK